MINEFDVMTFHRLRITKTYKYACASVRGQRMLMHEIPVRPFWLFYAEHAAYCAKATRSRIQGIDLFIPAGPGGGELVPYVSLLSSKKTIAQVQDTVTGQELCSLFPSWQAP